MNKFFVVQLLGFYTAYPKYCNHCYYTWAPAGIFAGGGGASPKKAPLKTKKAPHQKKIEIVLEIVLDSRTKPT